MPYETQTEEQRKAANLKSYAKKLGLTVEQLEARRQAAREWKHRNKARRTKDGYLGGARKGQKKKVDKFWEALKAKHAGFEGTRLEKSIKPPVPLIHMDEA